jgi:hypothetical protein
LRYLATNRKVAGSRTNEVNELFSIYLILGPGAYSASDRNEYQKQKKMFLGSIARPALKADNLTAICEPTAYTMWDPQHLTNL